MSPISSTLAGASTRGYGGLGASVVLPVTNSYESIQTTVLSSANSTITFSSIPATFTHLQLRILARTSQTAEVDDFAAIRFNGDSGNNYVHHVLYSTGSGNAGSGEDRPFSSIPGQRLPSNTAGANIFGAIVMDILDYRNTNKYTITRNVGGNDRAGSGSLYHESNQWRNTDAVTSITITTSTGLNFLTNSHFALYGIKGA